MIVMGIWRTNQEILLNMKAKDVSAIQLLNFVEIHTYCSQRIGAWMSMISTSNEGACPLGLTDTMKPK